MNKYNKKQNNFLLNVITLVSGSAISQGILLTATPFLTRLYTPEEFGVFALYIAVVGIIAVVASWKFELAIMLPKKEADAHALLFLSVIITFITSILIFVLIFIFNDLITHYTTNFAIFMWLVPLGVLVTGLLQVFTAWSTRKEYFKPVSSARIVQSTSTSIGQICFKFTNIFSIGLIWGNLFGTLFSLLVLIFYTIKKHTIQLKLISRERIISNMKQYKDFPKYQSFSVLINSFSQHLPVILLTYFYQFEIAGFYMLTHRALNTPARLIGGSVRQVYYQRASKLFSENKSIKQLLKKTTIGLAKVSIIPYLILGILGRIIFTFIFGSEWFTSGIYAQILIIFIFILTINPPAVMTIQVLGMQKFHLKYEILLLIFRFLSIYIGYQFFNNHFISIGLFSFVGIAFNIFLIIFVFKKVQNI